MGWDDVMTEKLKALHGTMSAAQVADEIGCGLSRQAIIGKAYRLGLKGPERVAPVKRVRKPRAKKPGVTKFGLTVHGSLEAEPLPLPTIEDDAIPRHQLRTLFELQSHHCRYPIERDGETLFCAAAQKSDSSYCEYHHCICHRPTPLGRRSIWIGDRRIAA